MLIRMKCFYQFIDILIRISCFQFLHLFFDCLLIYFRFSFEKHLLHLTIKPLVAFINSIFIIHFSHSEKGSSPYFFYTCYVKWINQQTLDIIIEKLWIWTCLKLQPLLNQAPEFSINLFFFFSRLSNSLCLRS